ncbi:MAG: serine/threonine-protein kinase [Streptosporangiaceae bacterium]
MTIASGTRVGDRYRLEERLASGGMGEVWSATDEELGRRVAVKVLKPEHASDPMFRERFRAEARNTAALTHSAIAKVHDYIEDDQTAFLVMEYVPGRPLSALLAEGGPLDVDTTLDVAAQTARALQAAHDAGVIHRDIKPSNLIIGPSGIVKVTDLGAARALGTPALTQTGVVVGTVHYMAPEQAAGRRVTPATDIYALGIVAYECLAGRLPFRHDTPVNIALAHVHLPPPALPDDVPPAVRVLVGECLAKDPEDRPASAYELARRAAALRVPVQPAHAHVVSCGRHRRPLPTARLGARLALVLAGVLLLGIGARGVGPLIPLGGEEYAPGESSSPSPRASGPEARRSFGVEPDRHARHPDVMMPKPTRGPSQSQRLGPATPLDATPTPVSTDGSPSASTSASTMAMTPSPSASPSSPDAHLPLVPRLTEGWHTLGSSASPTPTATDSPSPSPSAPGSAEPTPSPTTSETSESTPSPSSTPTHTPGE